MTSVVCLSSFRRNRKGNVIKVVRENYLRPDIACGLLTCKQCSGREPNVRLDVSTPLVSTTSQQYVLFVHVDTLFSQFDVLRMPALKNFIIPQTGYKLLQQKSAKMFRELQEWIRDRKCYMFMNEHCDATFLKAGSCESAEEYQDRLSLAMISHYRRHMRETAELSSLQPLVLSESDTFALSCSQIDVQSRSMREYVESLVDEKVRGGLLDMIQSSEDEDRAAEKRDDFAYTEHYPNDKLKSMLAEKTAFQGVLQMSRENFRKGFVVIQRDDADVEVLIQGLKNLNRGIHEDVVIVEILPENEWFGETAKVEFDDDETVAKEGTDAAEGSTTLAADIIDAMDENETKLAVASATDRKVCAKIVGIVRRKWRPYVGVLQPSHNPSSSFHLFIPLEKRYPKVKIETRQYATLKDSRLLVRIDRWTKSSRYPSGHLVSVIGDIGDKATENECFLLEREIPCEPFSANVLACLPPDDWCITPEEVGKREDLRHLTICSVDPPGCTDIDDALHCRVCPDNADLLEIGVHIADVSHYVRPGTPIDREAAHRGTTVYLSDRRIDMLPDRLSSDLCSLMSNVDRLAFSCIWQMDPATATIKGVRFCKSVIRSCAAMTYSEAQTRIDNPNSNDEITKSLRDLNRLAKIMKSRRLEDGALTLASSEVRFEMDVDRVVPQSVAVKELLDTNSMVEEFMLLANISVAERLYADFPDCAVLRRHEQPAEAALKPVVEAAASRNFTLDVSTGKSLAASLNKAVIPSNPYFNTMLRMLTTRCMTQALYVCSGSVPFEQYFHFGLATPLYTHFTSPIRRYPDVLVHRLLAVSIRADEANRELTDKVYSQTLMNHLNFRNRMARMAARDSVALHTLIYFAKNPGRHQAYVLAVRENALQVLVPLLGLEVSMMLPQTLFTFDAADTCVTSADGVKLARFDPVKVWIACETAEMSGRHKLVVHLVEPRVENFSKDLEQIEADRAKGATERTRKLAQANTDVGGGDESCVKRVKTG